MVSVKAFLHEKRYGSSPGADEASPLLPLPLLFVASSKVEVSAVLHLTLNRFTDPRYLQEHQFCESTSYLACDVTDLVAPRIEWFNVRILRTRSAEDSVDS